MNFPDRHLEVDTLIEIYGDSVFSILPPIAEKLPFRINAHLTDNLGNTTMRIVENEWQSLSDNWDVETGGGRIVIRRDHGDIVLAIRVEPPDRLIIERLEMSYRGVAVQCKEKAYIHISTLSGVGFSAQWQHFHGCKVGIRVDVDGVKLGVGGGSVSLTGSVWSSRPSFTQLPSRMRRNQPCLCTSGKKYKHCCGRYSVA